MKIIARFCPTRLAPQRARNFTDVYMLPHTDTSQPHYLIAPCWDKFQGDARGVLFVWVKKGKQIRRELKLGMRLQLGDQAVRIRTLHFIYNNKRGFMTVVNEP